MREKECPANATLAVVVCDGNFTPPDELLVGKLGLKEGRVTGMVQVTRRM